MDAEEKLQGGIDNMSDINHKHPLPVNNEQLPIFEELMSILLTENAARQITKQLQKRGSGLGLRLGVKQSGCSGYAYVLDYADQLSENETVFEQFGVKVIVNNDDLKLLDGIELDYAREGLNEAFKFNNPNVTATCGCGESFSV